MTTVTEMRKISRKQYLECLRLRGSDRLNETFKAVCLNPVENTLGFLEDAQRLAMTQHLKKAACCFAGKCPLAIAGRPAPVEGPRWGLGSHGQRCHTAREAVLVTKTKPAVPSHEVICLSGAKESSPSALRRPHISVFQFHYKSIEDVLQR